jgi:hypothetical protein
MNCETKTKNTFLIPTRSFNGTGISLLGYKSLSGETYEVTRWVILFFLPLFPISTWEIRPLQIENNGIPFLNTRYLFDIVAKRKLNLRHILNIYTVTAGIILQIVILYFLNFWMNSKYESLLLGMGICWVVFCVLLPQQKLYKIYEAARVRNSVTDFDVPKENIKPNDVSISFIEALKFDQSNSLLLLSPLIFTFLIILLGLLGYVTLRSDKLASLFYLGLFVTAVCYTVSFIRGFLFQSFIKRSVIISGVVLYMGFNEQNSRANSYVPVYCAYEYQGQAYTSRLSYNFSDLDGIYVGHQVDMIVDTLNPARAWLRQMLT